MGNISTNLLRFNGEIGPQYLDPDDKTGGPDGTMKPITKDILREMIMLNLPEIQKVQDEYVKAELEQIKQQQQQILQRLNQPIDTQLTGSSTAFEIIKDTVVHLEPEQELVSDYFDNTSGNFSNFFINLYRAGQNNWQITVEISYDKSGLWRRVVRREILTPLEGEFQTLKGFDLAPYYINFRLKNIGSSNSTFYNVVVTFTR